MFHSSGYDFDLKQPTHMMARKDQSLILFPVILSINFLTLLTLAHTNLARKWLLSTYCVFISLLIMFISSTVVGADHVNQRGAVYFYEAPCSSNRNCSTSNVVNTSLSRIYNEEYLLLNITTSIVTLCKDGFHECALNTDVEPCSVHVWIDEQQQHGFRTFNESEVCKHICNQKAATVLTTISCNELSEPLATPRASPPVARPPAIAYRILTLEWPHSICTGDEFIREPCNPPVSIPKKFTIHGLWPKTSEDKDPECDKEGKNYNYKEIKSMEGRLNANWPNIFLKKRNDDIWGYQWDKHGACSGKSQKEFFQAALDLYDDFPITDADLEHLGIPPKKATTVYKASDVQSLLSSHYGAAVKITCVYNSRRSMEQLKEVQLNITKVGNKVQPMGRALNTCTGPMILFEVY